MKELCDMSEEMIQALEDHVSREIVRFCKLARTTEEIVTQLRSYYRSAIGGVPLDFELRNRTARRLAKMERAGVIIFNKNIRKWQSAESALEILTKYFGVRV